jgi:antitoxin (DNA-binding transcriptional repressor) of toxin-antitoxin stability system
VFGGGPVTRGVRCLCYTQGKIDFSELLADNPSMTQVSIDEIKRDFPAYLQRVEAGETLIIMEAGKPVAEIKPIVSDSEALRPFGLCAGQFIVPDDFDEPLQESIISEFEGR